MRKRTDRSTVVKAALVILLAITATLIISLIGETRNIPEGTMSFESDPRIEFYRSFVPLRKWEVDAPTIGAGGAAVVLIDKNGKKFLFDKNAGMSLPIASITKLMTVLVATEEYSSDHRLVISEDAFMRDLYRPNNLYPGETYKVEDLIYASLIESSNTAAHALAEGRTIFDYDRSDAPFISKMNRKAEELGMVDTRFSNPSGLDPAPGVAINRSSPRDLVTLVEHLLEIPMIWEALSTERFSLRTADGSFKYDMTNTNHLLGEIDNLVGGKTGTTARAGGNLLAVFERGDDIVITVILGSGDRFEETRSLLEWMDKGYYWEAI